MIFPRILHVLHVHSSLIANPDALPKKPLQLKCLLMARILIACSNKLRLRVSDSKQLQFDNLVERVAHCSLCPRMLSRTKVLTSLNGSLDSQIIFVAEAPGRLGADKYGLPLHGDQTGRNFEMFLNHSGFYRDSVFITNAVLCNPRSIDGNNDSPTISEIRNCSSFLDET